MNKTVWVLQKSQCKLNAWSERILLSRMDFKLILSAFALIFVSVFKINSQISVRTGSTKAEKHEKHLPINRTKPSYYHSKISAQTMSRISKEIFRKASLSSVILPYYSSPLSAQKTMLKLCKGSRSIWLENNSQWSNLLTHLRTKIRISWNKTANKHAKYLAKIVPFVELDFSIDLETPADRGFIANLASLIENKSLSKFKVNLINPFEIEDN